MFGKIASLGALAALLVSVSAVTAAPSPTCPVTGKKRWQCCASKQSPMPPCCMKGCDTPGQIFR